MVAYRFCYDTMLAVLRDVQKYFPGKTIDNIIVQIDSEVNEILKH